MFESLTLGLFVLYVVSMGFSLASLCVFGGFQLFRSVLPLYVLNMLSMAVVVLSYHYVSHKAGWAVCIVVCAVQFIHGWDWCLVEERRYAAMQAAIKDYCSRLKNHYEKM